MMSNPGDGPYRIHIVHGNSNPALAVATAAALGVTVTACDVHEQTSGEVVARAAREVAGGDVYVIQSGCANAELNVDVNTALFELLFLIRRLRLRRAARITAVVPFYPYARQDRKDALRCPLSAAAVAQFIEASGADRVITVDLHSGQVQGCFSNSPLDNLAFQHDFAQYLRTQPWFERDSTVVVSPDAGGVARAHQLAELLDIRGIVTIMKRRAAAGVVDSMQTVGEVAGRTCIIVDDMCDTGGTLIKACELLKSMGAVRVVACATHGILTEPCVDRLNAGTALDELIVSDSIPQDGNVKRCPKLRVLSIAPLLASAITMYHTEMSVGALFRAPSSLAHVVGSRRLTVSASGVNSGNPTSSRPHSTHNSPQTMNQTMSSSAFGPMLDTPTIIAANRRPFPPSPAE